MTRSLWMVCGLVFGLSVVGCDSSGGGLDGTPVSDAQREESAEETIAAFKALAQEGPKGPFEVVYTADEIFEGHEFVWRQGDSRGGLNLSSSTTRY